MEAKIIEGEKDRSLNLVPDGMKLTIEGSTGSSAGLFLTRGTELIIEGDAGAWLGKYMSCGDITIYGNAGELVGKGSKAGNIYLNCDFESIADDAKANIYRNNRLVDVSEYAAEKTEIDRYLEELE